MAPENGLGRPYNLKADVYSWSMVMWYIMALEPPMGLYTPRMIVEKVFTNGYRPATNVKVGHFLIGLLRLHIQTQNICCVAEFTDISFDSIIVVAPVM